VTPGLFGAADYDCRLPGTDQKPEFAVTRLRSGPRACYAEQAILVGVSLTPTFVTTVAGLRRVAEVCVRKPSDYLCYYLSQSLLRRVAQDNGISPAFKPREAFSVEDLVVAQITRSILSPVSRGEPLTKFVLDQTAGLLSAHVLQRYCDTEPFATGRLRGLEPWQKRKTEEMFGMRLEEKITTKALASACSLSESQFARSFRFSFGTSVHQRIIQLRIERAKSLLSQTGKSLVEIALLSGFCDQAAFTRSFSRIERITPSRWRRFHGELTRNDKTGKIAQDRFALGAPI
jgi:AraC family transcriptional regulator